MPPTLRMTPLLVALFTFACVAGTSKDPSNGGTSSDGTTGGGSVTTGGGTLSTLTYQPSTAAITNPERGFMKWTDIVNTTDLSFIRAAGATLGFAVLRLDDYRDGTDLPSTFLAQVNAGFANARAAHIKLVVRLVYNYPGSTPDAGATADAPVNVIQKHLNQVASLIANNTDVIAVMQAGFIGQWGEWHDSSSNLDDATDRLAVMNAVLAALPTSRYVLIRYPAEKRENWQGPLTAQTAFGSSAGARIGHHNDCFLDGQDNAGTYQTTADMNYLAADTFYVPMGGETCAVSSPYTDCPAALSDLATYHWAFLNGDFDTDVLNGWTSQGCMAQITNNLGYRFTLQSVTMNMNTTASSGALNVTVQMHNGGYARMFNQRPVYITLKSNTARHDYLLSAVDPRAWDPNAAATMTANVALGTIDAGTYTVALWMPDAATGLQSIPDYSVQFANTGT